MSKKGESADENAKNVDNFSASRPAPSRRSVCLWKKQGAKMRTSGGDGCTKSALCAK